MIVILTGAIWGADYELYAQRTVGRNAGLSDAAVAALSGGEIPDDLSDDEWQSRTRGCDKNEKARSARWRIGL